MGKNRLAEAPKEVAKHLGLDPEKYSFHSFRRSSATAAADAGASTDQMVDFFGWANQKMTTEYISTSKHAVVKMADRLSEVETVSNVTETSAEKNALSETEGPYVMETEGKKGDSRLNVLPETEGLHVTESKNQNSCPIVKKAEKVFVFPNYSGPLTF